MGFLLPLRSHRSGTSHWIGERLNLRRCQDDRLVLKPVCTRALSGISNSGQLTDWTGACGDLDEVLHCGYRIGGGLPRRRI